MKEFNLYHMKSLSLSDTELVLTDKAGECIYLYKKEKDVWVLYDTDIVGSVIKPTTSYRMSKIVVNVLPINN